MIRNIYSLNNIKYSCKRFSALQYILKGNICDIINNLAFWPQRRIAELIIKFLNYISYNTKSKLNNYKQIIVCECWTEKREIISRIKYTAKGRMSKIKYYKINIKLVINIT